MRRLYIPCKNISNGRINIYDKDNLHYLKNVLRVKPGDGFMVFDEKGNEYLSEVKELTPESINLSVKETLKRIKDKNLHITVACAIPKKSNMDDIVDKLTQLGVDELIPLETKRVIVKLNNKKRALKLTRWKKIALNASLQSQRNDTPVISLVKDIKKVLADSNGYDLKIIPTLEGSRKSLKEVISKFKPRNILVLIGPEGDFSDEEVALAKKSGCIPVTLGDLVLRVETAAVAVASFLKLYANG